MGVPGSGRAPTPNWTDQRESTEGLQRTQYVCGSTTEILIDHGRMNHRGLIEPVRPPLILSIVNRLSSKCSLPLPRALHSLDEINLEPHALTTPAAGYR